MTTTPGVGPIGLGSIQSRIAAIEGRFGNLGGPTPAVSTPPVTATSRVRSQSVDALSGAGFQDVLSGLVPDGSPSIARAIEWGRGEIGTPYAAVNPFRFGDVPWDGRAHQSVNGNGKTYQYPAGTKVYDCSGYVTAVYRQIGLDLAKYNATTSESMRQRIPEVSMSEIRPGDLLIIDSDRDGVSDHVELYQGNGRVLEATGSGVKEDAASFDTTIKVVRPSLLEPQRFFETPGAVQAAGAQPLLGLSSDARAAELLSIITQNRLSTMSALMTPGGATQ